MEEKIIYVLLELIFVLVHDIMESDLEVVKWRQALIKHLCPPFSDFLEYDILNGLHAGTYWSYPGYWYFVKNFCGGRDPHQSSSYHCQMHRMKKGTSIDSDHLTFSISQRGGLKMLADVLNRLKADDDSATKEEPTLKLSDALCDDFEDLIVTYDTEAQYLHEINDELMKDLNEAEKAIFALRDEVYFLYALLRRFDVPIPVEGHPVRLYPFADKSDSRREEYEGEYELPWYYFDSDVFDDDEDALD